MIKPCLLVYHHYRDWFYDLQAMALVRTLLRSISNLSICRMTSKFSLNASRANSLFTSVFTINLSLVSIGRELKVSNSAVNFWSSLKNNGTLGLTRWLKNILWTWKWYCYGLSYLFPTLTFKEVGTNSRTVLFSSNNFNESS